MRNIDVHDFRPQLLKLNQKNFEKENHSSSLTEFTLWETKWRYSITVCSSIFSSDLSEMPARTSR